MRRKIPPFFVGVFHGRWALRLRGMHFERTLSHTILDLTNSWQARHVVPHNAAKPSKQMGCLPFASLTGKQGIWVPILLFRSFLPAHNAPSLVGEYLPQAPKNAQQVCGYAMEHCFIFSVCRVKHDEVLARITDNIRSFSKRYSLL